MIHVLNQKVIGVTPPAAIIDNAAAVTAAVDAMGARWVTFIIYLGALDIAVAAMKLRESDDDSSYSDVPGADFSVLPALLPIDTKDNKIYGVQVPMLGRKRYLDLSLTLGDGSAGTYVTVLAILSDLEAAPYTAADRGFEQELFAG